MAKLCWWKKAREKESGSVELTNSKGSLLPFSNPTGPIKYEICYEVCGYGSKEAHFRLNWVKSSRDSSPRPSADSIFVVKNIFALLSLSVASKCIGRKGTKNFNGIENWSITCDLPPIFYPFNFWS